MSSTFPEAKLDPRVKRTRQLLEQSFLDVVTEKGFQSASVQDIAEKAGVNRATFYDHFPDKYALLDYSVRSPQFESVMETQVKEQVQELLQNWIQKLGTDVDPKIAATATSWAIYGLAMQWSHDKSKMRPTAEDFTDQVLPLIAGNLRLTQPA